MTAKDKATGKEQAITITASSGISEAEINRMVEDAEEHEAEDQARRDAVSARNELDQLIYGTKKLLDENGDKVADADKLMVEEAIKGAQEVLERNQEPTEAEELRGAIETLQSAAHKLAEAMYKGAGGDEGGGDAGDEDDFEKHQADLEDDESPEDIIDAEFEDSDSSKNN